MKLILFVGSAEVENSGLCGRVRQSLVRAGWGGSPWKWLFSLYYYRLAVLAVSGNSMLCAYSLSGSLYFWELFCRAVIKRSPQEGIEASLDFPGGLAVARKCCGFRPQKHHFFLFFFLLSFNLA